MVSGLTRTSKTRLTRIVVPEKSVLNLWSPGHLDPGQQVDLRLTRIVVPEKSVVIPEDQGYGGPRTDHGTREQSNHGGNAFPCIGREFSLPLWTTEATDSGHFSVIGGLKKVSRVVWFGKSYM